jgi:hypothetical protein
MERNLLSKLFRGNYYFLQGNYMYWAWACVSFGMVAVIPLQCFGLVKALIKG